MDKINVVFILDRSGSMNSLKEDAVGGYNNLIEELKKLDDNIFVTTVLFNNEKDIIQDRISIKDIKGMDVEDYCPSGSTALLDAIGSTIDYFLDIYEKEGNPKKTLFYITTDGMENSSVEYTYKMISRMIKNLEKDTFKFHFIASGINEQEVGLKMGMNLKNITKVEASSIGQKKMYSTMFRAIKKEVLNE